MVGHQISTKTRKKLAKSFKDWKWWHTKVLQKLVQLNKEGFKVVIFTNQGGIAKGKTKKWDITKKIENM